MKHNKNTGHQSRRDSGGILYCFADGVLEITLEMFLSENPDATQEDYQKWKDLCARLFAQERRDSWRQTHKNVLLHEETLADVHTDSAEDAYFSRQEEEAAQAHLQRQRCLLQVALERIGKKQRRRFLMHVAHGMSCRDIAAVEGVSHQTVHRSILRARATIEQYLSHQTK